MLEKAFSGSRRYWAWVAFLLLVISVGVYFWFRQLDQGLGITGMNRDVTWGFYIAQFTFLVGVAASAVMVVIPYYLHNYKQFGRLTVLGEFLAIAACLMCVLFIFMDMGQPMRVLNMMIYPQPRSIMFWDFLSLFGYLIINVVVSWTTLSAERRDEHAPGWVKPFIYLSVPWAVSIHTVTAFLYCGLAGRPFWLTAILAPRFLASAFAAGPSLLLLLCVVVRKYTRFDPGEVALRKLGQIITYAMLANVFFVLLEVFVVAYSQMPEHMAHFQYLYLGYHGHTFLVPFMWTSVALAVVSVVLLVNPRTRNNLKVLPFAAAFVFVSLWIEKGLGMVVTGFVPSPLHKVTEYAPTGPELSISLAVWAAGLLILTLLYKVAISVKESLA